MHILITGAAGMIGRKLTERLAGDGGLNGKRIDKMTLLDVVAPAAALGFAGGWKRWPPICRSRAKPPTPSKTPRRHLPSAGGSPARPGSISTRAIASISTAPAPCSSHPRHQRRLSPAPRLHIVHRSVRRAVSDSIPDDFHLPRSPTAPRRRSAKRCSPTMPGAVSATASASRHHRGAAGQAQQGGLGLLLRHHPRAAGRPRGCAAGGRDGRAHPCEPRSAVGFLLHAAALPRNALGPRINLSMPGVCCTVAEQIAALRRIAGDRVARIRRENDPLVARIVAGWPQRIEARRARDSASCRGSFDEIVRIHIDQDRGGNFVELVGASRPRNHRTICSRLWNMGPRSRGRQIGWRGHHQPRNSITSRPHALSVK